MARKRLNVELSPEEYKFLTTYVAHGHKNARSINRARTLLMAHNGKEDPEIAKTLGISRATVYNVRRRYHQHRHEDNAVVLQDKPRKGRPMVLDAKVEATVAKCLSKINFMFDSKILDHVFHTVDQRAPTGICPKFHPLILHKAP